MGRNTSHTPSAGKESETSVLIKDVFPVPSTHENTVNRSSMHYNLEVELTIPDDHNSNLLTI